MVAGAPGVSQKQALDCYLGGPMNPACAWAHCQQKLAPHLQKSKEQFTQCSIVTSCYSLIVITILGVTFVVTLNSVSLLPSFLGLCLRLGMTVPAARTPSSFFSRWKSATEL